MDSKFKHEQFYLLKLIFKMQHTKTPKTNQKKRELEQNTRNQVNDLANLNWFGIRAVGTIGKIINGGIY